MYTEDLNAASRESLETVFRDDTTLVNKLWSELAGTTPELRTFIGHEALRLFPDDATTRAKATRLVVETLQALRVAELETNFE